MSEIMIGDYDCSQCKYFKNMGIVKDIKSTGNPNEDARYSQIGYVTCNYPNNSLVTNLRNTDKVGRAGVLSN